MKKQLNKFSFFNYSNQVPIDIGQFAFKEEGISNKEGREDISDKYSISGISGISDKYSISDISDKYSISDISDKESISDISDISSISDKCSISDISDKCSISGISKKKTKKKQIPKHIKTLIWNKYIGDDIIKHRCLCCKNETIRNTDFEAGHVLSEYNGGTSEISNLRPICRPCNSSMGTMHMIDYIKKYGLYI